MPFDGKIREVAEGNLRGGHRLLGSDGFTGVGRGEARGGRATSGLVGGRQRRRRGRRSARCGEHFGGWFSPSG